MKSIRSFLFSLVALALLLTSNHTKAGVGAIFASPVIVTTGLVMAGSSAAATGIVYGLLEITKERSDAFGYLIMMFFTGAAAMIGLVILDGEQGMSYSEISQESGYEIGLTNEEIDSYNFEIDQVNALASYVDSQMAEIKKPAVEDAKAAWEEVADAVAPETFSAMQKITAHMYAR